MENFNTNPSGTKETFNNPEDRGNRVREAEVIVREMFNVAMEAPVKITNIKHPSERT